MIRGDDPTFIPPGNSRVYTPCAESASATRATAEAASSVEATSTAAPGWWRNAFLMTEKQCSMGWKSGVYGGKKHGVNPLSMIVSITSVVLWIEALSINMTSRESVFSVDRKSAKMAEFIDPFSKRQPTTRSFETAINNDHRVRPPGRAGTRKRLDRWQYP